MVMGHKIVSWGAFDNESYACVHVYLTCVYLGQGKQYYWGAFDPCDSHIQSALHIIITSYPRSACVPYAPHTPGPVAEIGAEMTISEYSTYLYFDLQMNNK